MMEQLDRPRASLLITDLDNTLWDWFHAWHESFAAMLLKLTHMTRVPQALLEKEIRAVHQERGTTEYSMLIAELPSIRALHPDRTARELLDLYDPALHVMNSERCRATRLYPGVEDTLRELRHRNVRVIAYTESVAYWSEWRIRKTGLDGLITVLYSAPDHDFPRGMSASDIRKLPTEEYGLKATVHRHVPRGVLKPYPTIVDKILSDFGAWPEQVVYVGDSLMKDVAMAQQARVKDVHAAYGVVQHKEGYDLLRRVSHWSSADIERERAIAERPEVVPTYTLAESFSELLDLFEFGEL